MKKINVLIMLACMILASCKPEPVGNPEPDGNDVLPSTIVLEVKDITSLSAKTFILWSRVLTYEVSK